LNANHIVHTCLIGIVKEFYGEKLTLITVIGRDHVCSNVLML